MALPDHNDVAHEVRDALKMLSARGYRISDVHIVDFPFANQPPYGVLVSPLVEVEGDSQNSTSDIGYRCLITRCGVRLNAQDGFQSRDDWRRDVWRRFNRVRLGFDCELATRCEFHDIQMQQEWSRWNIDASALIVTTWIREPHNG